jgi:uncharacterized membrane protein
VNPLELVMWVVVGLLALVAVVAVLFVLAFIGSAAWSVIRSDLRGGDR